MYPPPLSLIYISHRDLLIVQLFFLHVIAVDFSLGCRRLLCFSLRVGGCVDVGIGVEVLSPCS